MEGSGLMVLVAEITSKDTFGSGIRLKGNGFGMRLDTSWFRVLYGFIGFRVLHGFIGFRVLYGFIGFRVQGFDSICYSYGFKIQSV